VIYIVIEPVSFILIESCINTKACNSKRGNIIIFYYCGELLSKPRELASQ